MPDILSTFQVSAVAAVFVLAGFVKGVIGLGLPTVAIGLLGLLMPVAEAAALLVVPSLLTNVWQVVGSGFAALLRRLAPLFAGICAGVAVGAGWLSGDDPTGARWAGLGLGIALCVYATLGLLAWRPRVSAAAEPWLGPLAGVATGLVTAATGVFVLPAVPYLQALGLAKDELVRALGMAFLVATLALASSLGHAGVLEGAGLLASALAVAPALLGMAIGQWLRGRLATGLFRRCFLLGLFGLGAWLVAHGLARL
jgi:uncharacterized membrane protein YfcA